MKKYLLLTGLLVFIPFLILLLLLCTPVGLTLLSKTTLLFDDVISIERVEGKLSQKFSLINTAFRSEYVDVEVGQVDFQWQPVELFHGSLQIGELSIKKVVITIRETDSQIDTPVVSSEPVVLPEIAVPFGFLLKRFRIEDVLFRDQIETWWKVNYLDISARAEENRYYIDSLVFDAPEARFELEGSLTSSKEWPVSLKGTWQLTFEDYNEMGGDLSVEGPLERLNANVNATRPVTLSVTGVLKDLLNETSWTGTILGGEGSLIAINDSWPDIMLENLRTENAAGTFGTYGGQVSGTASYWRTRDVKLVVDLDGNEDGIVFSNVDVMFKESEGTASGEIGWVDKFYWKGKGQAENVNPYDYADMFAGSLKGTVTSYGEIGYEDEDLLSCYFDTQDLEGTIGDYPVTGSGRVRIEDVDVLFENVLLKSAESVIEMDGEFTDFMDFYFEMYSPDLDQFLPGSSGFLAASVIVYGAVDTPYISFDLDGDNLRYQGNSIGRIHGGGQVDFAPSGQIYADVTAEQMNIAGLNVDSATLLSTGVLEDHQVLAQLNSELVNGDLRLVGGVSDDVWNTDIQKFSLAFEQYGEWDAQKRASMTLSEQDISIDNLCLTGAGGTLCTTADLGFGGEWKGDVISSHFDLAYILETLGLDLDTSGTVSTSLAFSGDSRQLLSSNGWLEVHDGQLVLPEFDDETRTVYWDENRVDILLDERDLQLSLLSAFNDGSVIKADVSGTDFGGFTGDIMEKKIGGTIDIAMKNGDDLSFLTSYTVRAKGGLDGKFTLAGDLTGPIIDGRLQLDKDGSIFIPAAGITLKETDVTVEMEKEQTRLFFTAKSGEGAVAGTGLLYYPTLDRLTGSFIATGQHFTAVKLPEYEVMVNPDVQFVFNRETGRLSGNIEVPKARIAPEGFAAAASESKDVVYVDQREDEQNLSWPLVTDLDITLGEEVLVDSFGLYGYLHGELEVNGEPGEDLTGYGQLNLDKGTFSIYGRVLDIERGRVSFTGGPIENPFLDVRAQRSVNEKVAGRSGGWTVGVDVSGTVDDMHFALFSSPVMAESDILAYMIVGHSAADADSEEDGLLETAATAVGVEETARMMKELSAILPVDEMHMEGGSQTEDASIVVGKSLTDNLFIGYDYNFFKSTSEFILRYDLGRGFFIETKSSTEANGADLIYTFKN